jgi:hypothetical protein
MKKGWMGLTAMAIGMSLAYPAQADEVADLKSAIEKMSAEMEALKQRQAQLEARPAPAPAPAAPVGNGTAYVADPHGVIREGDIPGSFKFPGTNTSVRVGGYIDLTATKEFGVNMGGTFILPAQIPLPGSPTAHRDGEFYLTARRSRLDITTMTPTSIGNVGTVLQGDFYGAGGTESVTNSYGFRLRLAYATIGNWTIGQDWSTVFEPGSAIDLIDFGGGIGAPSAPRQALARYTIPLTANSNLALAAENAESDIFNVTTTTAGAGTNPVPSQTIDKYPDLAARYTITGGWGRLGIAGVVRRLTLNNEGAAAVGGFTGQQSKTAAVWLAMGRFNLPGSDSIEYSLLAGNGVGRYMVDSTSPSAYVDPDDERLKLIFGKGASFAYQHNWAPTLRSSFIWMGSKYDLHHSIAPGGMPPTTISQTQLLFANLIWTPTPADFIGVEAGEALVRGDGVVAPVTSDKQHASRLQVSYRRLF